MSFGLLCNRRAAPRPTIAPRIPSPISGLKHLDVMKDNIVMQYEEKADA
jgi:hypothetical protein